MSAAARFDRLRHNYLYVWAKKNPRQRSGTRDSAAIRTQDLLLRRQLLYPAELRNQSESERNESLFSFPSQGLVADAIAAANRSCGNLSSRDTQIRTGDLLLPKQAR